MSQEKPTLIGLVAALVELIRAVAVCVPGLLPWTLPFVRDRAIKRATRFFRWPLAGLVFVVLTETGRERFVQWYNRKFGDDALLRKYPWLKKKGSRSRS